VPLTLPDEERRPLLGLCVAIVAISFGAILMRASDAPSTVAAFYCVCFTTLALLPVALWRYGPTFRRLDRRDLAFARLESSIVSVSLLGESPTQFTVVGGAVVLAGIALTASETEPDAPGG